MLLVVVDTLRADHLSSYGYRRATTPNLDRLAERGILFTHAQSPRPKTTPAMASLLTGLYPQDHGVRDLSMPLERGPTTLAEVFSEEGWDTFAIIGNWVLGDERSGLARGFDRWVEELPQTIGVPPSDVPQRTARSLTDAALVALGLSEPPADPGAPAPRRALVREGSPWFLWLHYMDPHGLYDPPAEHREFRSAEPEPIPAVGADGEPPRVATYNVPPEALLEGDRIDAARVRDLYDGEIRFADAEIGRLLGALEEAGELERTLVVVTSDHGESLGEHDYWFEHGFYVYEPTCRVPLVVHPPLGAPGRPSPGVRAGDVSLVDLGPTILELAGLPPRLLNGDFATEGPRGRSRARLLEADDLRPHPVFSEKTERMDLSGSVQMKAVRVGDWKLIRRYAQRFELAALEERELYVLSEELYDLSADPGETENLAASPPPGAPIEMLRAELARFLETDRDFSDLPSLLQRRREQLEGVDPETLRKLEALGY